MIYELMKRDPAWKLARYMMGAFALAGLLTPASFGVSTFVLILGSANAGLLQTGNLVTRSSLFYAALPIPGRQLFLARVMVCLSLAAAPSFAAAAAHALAHPNDLHDSLATLAMGAVFAFGTLCALSLRIERIAGWPRIAVVFLWGAVIVSSVSAFWPPAALPVTGAAVAGCAIRWLTIWPRVPASFQVAPFEAVEANTTTRAAQVPPSAWWAIVRATLPWQAWIMIPIALAQAAFTHMLLALFFMFGTPLMIRERARWLAALPISTCALLALALAPYLLPLAVGYPVQAYFGHARDLAPSFTADTASGAPTVKAPLEYWRRAAKGKAPVVQAPWGETFQPPVTSILGVAVYNPYACGPANSERFQYWQYSRVAGAIYGEPLTYDEVEAGRRAGRLAPVTMRGRGLILGTALLLFVALVLQWAIGLNYWKRLPEPPARKLVAAATLLIVFGAGGLDFWRLTQGPGSVGMALFNSTILHGLRWLPDSFTATVGVAILLVAAPYFLMERQFRESELTGATRAAGALGQSPA